MPDSRRLGVGIADPDAAYRMLIEAHRGLSDDESAALNARLVLVLVHAVGDSDAIAGAIRIAKEAGPESACVKPERSGLAPDT